MFDQIKDLYNLKKQAQEMQKQLAVEKVTGFSDDKTFSLTLNGNQELLELNISSDINLSHPEIEKNIKQAYVDAQNRLKSLIAQKFQGLI
jgi:DNA-binding protein YbaB